jgi:hypothetical protein
MVDHGRKSEDGWKAGARSLSWKTERGRKSKIGWKAQLEGEPEDGNR